MIPVGATFTLYGAAHNPTTGRIALRLDSRRMTENGSTSLGVAWGTESWPQSNRGYSEAMRRTLELNTQERDRFAEGIA